jgi:hypothetical protein
MKNKLKIKNFGFKGPSELEAPLHCTPGKSGTDPNVHYALSIHI